MVITDVGGGDGLAHWRRGPRDGVAAKIDGHGAESRARMTESEGRTTGSVARARLTPIREVVTAWSP